MAKSGSMPPVNPSGSACLCGNPRCVCGSCAICSMQSEMQAYARPQDYGTFPEKMRLVNGGASNTMDQYAFPRPDPDNDGDSCARGTVYPGLTGVLGVTDYTGGLGPEDDWLGH